MTIEVHRDGDQLGVKAASVAVGHLGEVIAMNGRARIIAATGASQFVFLEKLVASADFDWSLVEMFHLDEYVGLPVTHPASFRKYLLDRLIHPAGIKHYHLLDGDWEPRVVCKQVGVLLSDAPVDLAFVGIGENGHLAFNDPPADFETVEPYLVVELDEACRQQQVGEGWFKSLAEVPTHAISMSIRQIMKAKRIICVVPDKRKAKAVQACLEGPISPLSPASILQSHPDVTVFLDTGSASLLQNPTGLTHAV